MPSDESQTPDDKGTPAPAPEYVTAAQVAEMVTGAVKSNLAKAMKSLPTDLNLSSLISDAVKAAVVQAPTPPEGDRTPDGKFKSSPDPRVAALESTLADMQKKLELAEKARSDAEMKRRDDAAFQDLRAALAPHVRPGLLDAATKLLSVADKRLTFDEHGRPLLTVRKAPFQGGEEEDVAMPLTDGVAFWAKKEGAEFAPPPQPTNVKGTPGPMSRQVATGSNGLPRYDSIATTDDEKAQRAIEAELAIRKAYNIS